jgi:N utilization substance protein A
LVALRANKVQNRDDLAEFSVDELTDIVEISEEAAADLIMKARAHWFADEA